MGQRPATPAAALPTALLASASHELRTPLNAVLGMLELSLNEPLAPVVREYLSTACESARTLTANLNLLLELAEAETLPVRIGEAPLDFHKIVKTAIRTLPIATQERTQIHIADTIDASLFGDEAQLERLLATLVEQAARGSKPSRIFVEIGGQPQSPEHFLLHIGVSENGPISSDQQGELGSCEVIESPYDATHGLALAAVRRWLERVGGHFHATSQAPGGILSVQLPLARSLPTTRARTKVATPPAAVQQQQQQQQQHWQPVRPEAEGMSAEEFAEPLDVLVVDDTEANQKVVKAVLAKRGHRVELAGNGQQALAQIRRREFDVVLMDAQMPLMNGLEATAAIRKLPKEHQSRVPIIAMTAHAFQEDRLRCLAAGMDDYLAKPIDIATLIAHVEFYGHRAIQSRSQNRDATTATATNDPRTTPSDARSLPAQDFLAGARARLAGDEPLLLELIRLFCQDATSLLEKISIGITAKDSEVTSRAAHNLRGLAANFDDARTISAAGAVEKLALEGEFELATAHLDTLRDECSRLINALTAYEREQNSRNDF